MIDEKGIKHKIEENKLISYCIVKKKKNKKQPNSDSRVNCKL